MAVKFNVGDLEVNFVKGEKIQLFHASGRGMLHNNKLDWKSVMDFGSLFSYDGTGNMIIGGKHVLKDGKILKQNVTKIQCRFKNDFCDSDDSVLRSYSDSGSVINIGSDSDTDDEMPPLTEIQVAITGSDEKVSENDAENQCIICWENKIQCAALPCGHYKYCISCSEKIRETNNPKCSVCRKAITQFVKIY